jgi:alpha-tubulin suppressor-like RCC1 family protein
VALGASFNGNCALYGGGSVSCWGQAPFGGAVSATPQKVPGISAAYKITRGIPAGHICVLISGGEAMCWGRNDKGQLGTGAVSPGSTTPVSVSNLGAASDIATGGSHTCAVLSATGGVRCWGDNTFGQLGNATFTPSAAPVDVVGLPRAVSVTAGRNYSCALLVGGNVDCWGAGPVGNPAVPPTGTSTPVGVMDSSGTTPLAGVSQISGGDSHACAVIGVASDPASGGGSVVCWGLGLDGQLGNNSTASSTLPVQVMGMLGATQISAGASHTCAVSTAFTSETDGMACWGAAIVDGRAVSSSVAVPIDVTFTRVMNAGALSSCAYGQLLLANPPALATGVGCWGHNTDDQLGNLGGDSAGPEQVPGL